MLLEVIEADYAVYFIPVIDASFKGLVRRKTQVDVLIKKNVEQFQEEDPICEVIGKVGDWVDSILLEDGVDDALDVFGLFLVDFGFRFGRMRGV